MRISDWSSDVCSSDLRSPDQERTQRNDHRKRCQDGPRERFIDRQIENWNDLHLPVFSQIFSNSIINDNGIVKRIANDGQYRSHDVEIEFKLCQREKSEGQRHVMDKGEQRSEEHTSELQSLMRISYAVFCLKKKKQKKTRTTPY